MLVFSRGGSVNDGFSYWDSSSGWTRINIDDALYFLRTNSTDQYSGTYSTYMEGISSDGVVNNIIPSRQGFFIHVTDGGWQVTGTFAINNNASIVNITHPFSKSGEEGVKPIVRIVAGYSGDTLSYDPFVIYYDDKATYNFDGQLDALKIYNSDKNVTNFYVFGSDGSKLSIDAIPINTDSLCILRLGLKTEKDGEITIRIKDITGKFLEETILLYDVITGFSQNLFPEGVYKLYLPAGDYQNRFYLNLSNQATAIPEIPSVTDRIKIYSSHGIVKVEINPPEYKNGVLTMCNLTG
jgi:fibronectin-binding autotransporter adhesin